jgi:hypothetical protein
MRVCELDSSVSGEKEQVADSCVQRNEPSGSLKCGEFLDQMNDC